MLKIRPTNAIPNLATVLLMGPPITLDSKGLATFPASEGLEAMLSLEVCLDGPEVLEGP